MTTTEPTTDPTTDQPTSAPTNGATASKAETRKIQVDYGIEFVDAPPPPRHGGGGGQPSVLENLLTQVRDGVNSGNVPEDRWARIGRYKNASAATAAANVLRQRYGRDESANGLTFQTGRLDDNSMGLFVRFRPSRVIEGAADLHKEAEAKRLAGLEAKRAGREQESEAATTEKNAGKPQGSIAANPKNPQKKA